MLSHVVCSIVDGSAKITGKVASDTGKVKLLQLSLILDKSKMTR